MKEKLIHNSQLNFRDIKPSIEEARQEQEEHCKIPTK